MAKSVSRKGSPRKPISDSLFFRAIYIVGVGLTIAALLQLVALTLLQLAEHIVRK